MRKLYRLIPFVFRLLAGLIHLHHLVYITAAIREVGWQGGDCNGRHWHEIGVGDASVTKPE